MIPLATQSDLRLSPSPVLSPAEAVHDGEEWLNQIGIDGNDDAVSELLEAVQTGKDCGRFTAQTAGDQTFIANETGGDRLRIASKEARGALLNLMNDRYNLDKTVSLAAYLHQRRENRKN